jgi:polyphosphate kinase 2 (PPK2 family)
VDRSARVGRRSRATLINAEGRRRTIFQPSDCQGKAHVEQGRTSGERVVVVLEGRDAAGKGGTIKAITERVSPRVFRVKALPAPSDREKSQMYIQRGP